MKTRLQYVFNEGSGGSGEEPTPDPVAAASTAFRKAVVDSVFASSTQQRAKSTQRNAMRAFADPADWFTAVVFVLYIADRFCDPLTRKADMNVLLLGSCIAAERSRAGTSALYAAITPLALMRLVTKTNNEIHIAPIPDLYKPLLAWVDKEYQLEGGEAITDELTKKLTSMRETNPPLIVAARNRMEELIFSTT